MLRIIYKQSNFENELKVIESIDRVSINKLDVLKKFNKFIKYLEEKDSKKRNDLIDVLESFIDLKNSINEESYIISYYGRELMGFLICSNVYPEYNSLYKDKLKNFSDLYLKLKKRFEGN